MKPILLTTVFSLLLLCSASQENGQSPKMVLGARLDVSTDPYAYSLKGVVMLGQRHAISMGPCIILGTNPFKENYNLGAHLNYDFYLPKLGTRRINFVLQTNLQYNQKIHQVKINGKENGYVEKWVYNTIGIGINARICHQTHLQATTNFLTAFYHDDPGTIYWTDGPHLNPVAAFSRYWMPAQVTLALTHYFVCNKNSDVRYYDR